MTWDEFKAEVDRRLAELGHRGSTEIRYIDTDGIGQVRQLKVTVETQTIDDDEFHYLVID